MAAMLKGRGFVTNGPLLNLRINDSRPGDDLKFDTPRSVRLHAMMESIVPLNHLQVVFNGNVIEEIPLSGNRRRAELNKLVSASLAPILQYASGTPLSFVTSTSPLPGFWNGAVNRANVGAGDLRASGFDKGNFDIANLGSSKNTYLNKSLFSDPAPLTLGTGAYSYGQARDFGIISEDLALQKNFYFHEKFRTQFRADFLNLFNRHYLGGIVTNPTSPLFGQVTGVGGKAGFNVEDSRSIQLGLRLDF
jgi:hypothetical protein